MYKNAYTIIHYYDIRRAIILSGLRGAQSLRIDNAIILKTFDCLPCLPF